MRIVMLGLLLLFVLSSSLENVSASTYVYENPFYPERTLSIRHSDDVVAFGDIGWEASFCDDSSDFICMSSGLMAFSVPKCEIKEGDEWNHLGVSFMVVESYEVTRSTGQETIFLIESGVQSSEMAFVFSFSRESGLLGIRTRNKDDEHVAPDLFMIGGRGFGAGTSNGNCQLTN